MIVLPYNLMKCHQTCGEIEHSVHAVENTVKCRFLRTHHTTNSRYLSVCIWKTYRKRCSFYFSPFMKIMAFICLFSGFTYRPMWSHLKTNTIYFLSLSLFIFLYPSLPYQVGVCLQSGHRVSPWGWCVRHGVWDSIPALYLWLWYLYSTMGPPTQPTVDIFFIYWFIVFASQSTFSSQQQYLKRERDDVAGQLGYPWHPYL